MLRKYFLLVVSVLLSSSMLIVAQSHQASSPLDQYVEQASEFSSRARANVYFSNPQSIFVGVQFNFVNVGAGNLTFLRRDMVASGRIPLMLARVYDSGGKGSAEFGPGWSLSAAETISLAEGKAHLTTESGSVVDFVEAGDNRFQLEKDYPTDYLSLAKTAPETFQVSLRTGLVKEFKLVAGEFRLAKVTDRNGNEIRLMYSNGLLARMENANHSIVFTRNKSGRVNLAQDDQGRTVHYNYDKKGRLIEADDLGDHAWQYNYSEGGRLKSATDPLQRPNFTVVFDDAGRVRRLQLPSGTIQYNYDATTRSTTVIDRKQLTSRFFQNEDGVTTRVVNALGEETAIGLGPSRNVISVARNGSVVESMQYDQQCRLVSRHSTTDAGSVDRQYSYDSATGLLSGIKASSGGSQNFSYDGKASLANATLADGAYTFGHSSSGDLTSFSAPTTKLTFTADSDGLIASMSDENNAVTALRYNAGGELAEAIFPDKTRAKYEYQPSGLRSKLVYQDGRRVEYSYDPTGNLTGTKVFDSKGKQVNGQKLEMNDSYQLVRWVLFDGTESVFRYDSNGNLTEIKKAKSTTRFEYDALDRLTTVVTPAGERLTYTYKPGERSLIEQHEHAGILVADLRDSGFTFSDSLSAAASRPLTSALGSVRFSESLGTFQLANTDGSEVVRPQESIEGALVKLHLFAPGMTQKGRQDGFNVPFNTMFVPAEYLTINCCPECYYDSDEGWVCPPCTPPPPDDAFNIDAAASINDGSSANFSLTVTGGNATSYAWTFSAPQGAGNAPNVSFSSPNGASTNTDAHWFASPNNACTASTIAVYTINARVQFDDGGDLTDTSSLSVSVPWQPAGTTDPRQNDITGAPTMAPRADGTWVVTGIGTLGRKVPTSSTIFVPPSSQFFNKTVQHEQVHVNQWIVGPGHLYGDLWSPQVFFGRISSFTAQTQANLLTMINTDRLNYGTLELGIYQQRLSQAEAEAHAVSDPINPQYIYQTCP